MAALDSPVKKKSLCFGRPGWSPSDILLPSITSLFISHLHFFTCFLFYPFPSPFAQHGSLSLSGQSYHLGDKLQEDHITTSSLFSFSLPTFPEVEFVHPVSAGGSVKFLPVHYVQFVKYIFPRNRTTSN